MSEDSEIIYTEPPAPSSISHRRILWITALVAVFGGIAGLIFVSRQFGAGFFFGGILSFVNYYWLKISLGKVFDNALARGEKPRFLAVRYFSRYLTLGIVLAVVFLTHTIPVISVILGLASFALAVVVEGLIRIFSTFFKNRKL